MGEVMDSFQPVRVGSQAPQEGCEGGPVAVFGRVLVAEQCLVPRDLGCQVGLPVGGGDDDERPDTDEWPAFQGGLDERRDPVQASHLEQEPDWQAASEHDVERV